LLARLLARKEAGQQAGYFLACSKTGYGCAFGARSTLGRGGKSPLHGMQRGFGMVFWLMPYKRPAPSSAGSGLSADGKPGTGLQTGPMPGRLTDATLTLGSAFDVGLDFPTFRKKSKLIFITPGIYRLKTPQSGKCGFLCLYSRTRLGLMFCSTPKNMFKFSLPPGDANLCLSAMNGGSLGAI
jgi:hypothetical protein